MWDANRDSCKNFHFTQFCRFGEDCQHIYAQGPLSDEAKRDHLRCLKEGQALRDKKKQKRDNKNNGAQGNDSGMGAKVEQARPPTL